MATWSTTPCDTGAAPVRLSATARNGSVELHVVDKGPGFPPAFLPHAFERFSRPDEARSGRGAGLGLALVQAIAVAHGGSAFAANRHAGGADVWLSLPARSVGFARERDRTPSRDREILRLVRHPAADRSGSSPPLFAGLLAGPVAAASGAVTLSVDPTTPRAGSTVTFTGAVSPAGVTGVEIFRQTGSGWRFVVRGDSRADGSYRLRAAMRAPGQIVARAAGSAERAGGAADQARFQRAVQRGKGPGRVAQGDRSRAAGGGR